MSNISKQKQRYQRLAYNVIRDAIGFKFGIPIFLAENIDTKEAEEYLISLRTRAGIPITDKIEAAIQEKIDSRIEELQEDLAHCNELLSTENIWLELLDLKLETLKLYLDNLTDEEKLELAIIPKWTTLDCALGRPYINDVFTVGNEGTNGFS